MLKKILLLSITTLCSSNINAANLPNTISYKFQDKATISSTTALVNIKFYSTTLSNSNSNIRESAIKQLTQLMPNHNFNVVNYSEEKSASGAINIELDIQTRLTQNQVDKLKSELNKNSNNESIKIDVLNFYPSTKTLNTAKQKLMMNMYQSVQNYVIQFNKKTHSNYYIQNINFNSTHYLPRKENNTFTISQPPQAKRDINIAKDIQLLANVTLAQNKSSNYSDIKYPSYESSASLK